MAKTKTTPNSAPNSFQLAGDTTQVSYSTSGIDGKPHFSFKKGSKTLDFSGSQISSQTLKIGTLVSVTLAVVPDVSTTTFSILLPAITLPASNRQAFRTVGITTVTKTTIAGPPVGVQQTYTTVALRGTARLVVF
jgi:hypothetical protein